MEATKAASDYTDKRIDSHAARPHLGAVTAQAFELHVRQAEVQTERLLHVLERIEDRLDADAARNR